eukprot:COSAG01_NODE_8969_length_2599_cov_1.883600_3_plen_64_part_00
MLVHALAPSLGARQQGASLQQLSPVLHHQPQRPKLGALAALARLHPAAAAAAAAAVSSCSASY